ncbi:MAG: glycoside hydrolase family 3 N-terminal domain-containing protein, partial [Eubacteriales bacterium]|nr:glycoside hydrolase family 3 N-terminal domain-containing protein [Eubacteriales bacterium]
MDIEKVISGMTLEEKAGLCSGRDFWHTKAVERLGVPSVMMCDGPHGLRKQKGEGDHLGINESIETVCYPTASALASSFDRALLRRLGEALGRECQAENVGMLLGPGVNMKRSPLCGRNFEYFSEDPYLAGELGSAYVLSLQEQGVSACVKHFAANNQETRRQSGTSNLDERTLHEIYLPAFEAVVKKGGTRSVMCAYNAVNGVFCAENTELLTDILRKKWGFTGFVVTDWGAVKDRVNGLLAGLDLEMPGGPGSKDAAIVQAV